MSGLGTRLAQFYLIGFVVAIPIFLLLIIDNIFNISDAIFNTIRVIFAIVLLGTVLKPRIVSTFPTAFGSLKPLQERIILLSGLFFVLSATRAAVDINTTSGLFMAMAIALAVVLIGVAFILIVFDK